MRGKPVNLSADEGLVGITPACAGKTFLLVCRQPKEQDHPRVCGENVPIVPLTVNDSGSPPRVRGKPSVLHEPPFLTGITPACAGKTTVGELKVTVGEDHPRVCGENPYAIAHTGLRGGSPPRVRGKPVCGLSVLQDLRITPACAGKTYERQRRAERS